MALFNQIGPSDPALHWIETPAHRAWLRQDARRQVDFFRASLREDGGFEVLDWAGKPIAGAAQELHTTTRLVHSFALARLSGLPACDPIIDAGMEWLWQRHRDRVHGGYVWSLRAGEIDDGHKLAYGHVFVLLAAASAHLIGHPEAQRLFADVSQVIETRYWDEERGLLREEFQQDWSPFSNYRGMNANMHGVEAMLAAYEATGAEVWLTRAGRILDFFTARMAPAHGWRIPEHYSLDWQVDPAYRGNPMFRPPGSTPGHSFELGRLLLQHWDLAGRADDTAPQRARALIERAHADAWCEAGGYIYTLEPGGAPGLRNRYWWPVTEAIGAYAALIKLERRADDEARYRQLWHFAAAHFLDFGRGGWFPELDDNGQPCSAQFEGKPDLYHALQADLFPLAPGLSHLARGLA